MNRRFIIGCLASIAMFGFVNCSKDDSTDSSNGAGGSGGSGGGGGKTLTVKEKVMLNTWVEVARTAGGQDAYKSLDDCEKDNEHSFMSDDVYKLAEGSNVCDPSDPGPVLLDWALKSDKIITIARTDFDIDYITDSTFKISNGGVGGAFSNTYKKK